MAFFNMSKTRIKLFGDIEPEKVDLNYAFDLYIKDRDKGLAYIYDNIGYMIRGSKFRFEGYDNDLDMTSEIMLLIDRKLQEQIKKYNITENREPRMAKRTMCYIMVCIRGVMLNAMNASNNEGIIIYDEELYDLEGGIATKGDEDHELEYMKYNIVYNYDRLDKDRNIVILYLDGTPKRDIVEGLGYSRVYVDKVVKKIKNVVYNYLKGDVNYNGTIKRSPPETQDQSDTVRKNDSLKRLLSI